MYAGHAAIALGLKAREPRVAIVPLVIACYGPDWLELVLGIALGRSRGEVYSHLIPVVVAGALAAAAIYALAMRGPGAGSILVGWLLHWPADFFTAHKPLLDPHHFVGLDFYELPQVDFALEATLVVVACVWYARSFASRATQRGWVLLLGAALLAVQGTLDFGLWHSPDRRWTPKLAQGSWRPHLTLVLSVDDPSPPRMPVAFSLPQTPTASEQCRRMVRAVSSRWSA